VKRKQRWRESVWQVVNTCLRYALPQLENGAMLNPSPIAQPPGRKPISVLLVEDSDTDADLLIRALRQADYEPSYEMVQTSKEMEKALRLGPETAELNLDAAQLFALWTRYGTDAEHDLVLDRTFFAHSTFQPAPARPPRPAPARGQPARVP